MNKRRLGTGAQLWYSSACRAARTGNMRTREVGHDVIHDDQPRWKDEPHEAFEHQRHKERGGHNGEEHYEMRPCKLPELVGVHALLQSHHKQHDPCTEHAARCDLSSAQPAWPCMAHLTAFTFNGCPPPRYAAPTQRPTEGLGVTGTPRLYIYIKYLVVERASDV